MSDRAAKFAGRVLVVPDKPDVERDAVCEVWRENGGAVERLGKFWEPPALDARSVRVYGPDTFALVVAQKLGLELVSPADEILAAAPKRFLKRRVEQVSLALMASHTYPSFVKPVVPKLFRSAVYRSLDALQRECQGLEPETKVLVSEVVEIIAEARAFLLNRKVMTCSVYEGAADLAEARDLAAEIAMVMELPSTCVVDLALIRDRGWALLEFNSTWGAGLNGCDPEAVAECLERATHVLPLAKPERVIDGARFDDFKGFQEEFSREVLRESEWHGNLDAFNDMLRGGFGTPDGGFVLRWRNSGRSRERLGHPAMVIWLEEHVLTCHPSHRESMLERLAQARGGSGPTLFDELVEIIQVHCPGGDEAEDGVELVLE